VKVLCEVLGVSRSGFYAWKKRPMSRRAREDVRLTAEIVAANGRGRGVYGSPRIHHELKAKGERVARKRVARLMKQRGLRAQQPRRFHKTTDSKHKHPIAENVLQREFGTKEANKKWVTDVTYVPTREGWLYLAAIVDLYSRRVVGWASSETNDTALAMEALCKALKARRVNRGLLHHSDRGSPYASTIYQEKLKEHGMVGSMSRAGDCWDNAVAESFFASLKNESLHHHRFETRKAAHATIEQYIEHFYNPVRRHSTLNYLSPIQFELLSQLESLAA